MTTKACSKIGRKHTPIVSKKQRGMMGSAYGAKKAGREKPSQTPMSVWKMSVAALERHLKESNGKKLPRKVKRKK